MGIGSSAPIRPSIETFRPRKDSSARGSGVDKVFLILVILYLLVPLGATLAFGIYSGSNVEFTSYAQIFADSDFSRTLIFSLELALGATALAVLLVTPTAYWVEQRIPRARPLLDFLSLIPFAIPAIVMSLGLVEVYGSSNPLIDTLSFGLVPLLSGLPQPFNMYNSPQLLACSYVIISLPFVYRPIDNSLRAINTRVLSEAAASLGCGWWRTFLTIILPNIWPGVISAALLTFSTAMGEFTLASLFGIYTFPIYLNQIGQSDPRKAASLSVLSFLLTLLCVLGIILLARSRRGAPDRALNVTAAR